MLRFILRRLALGLVTLWILSIFVFFGTQILPGNPGRTILGPFADAGAVKLLNHQLGVDRPVYVQYGDWIGHFVIGDMGKSYALQTEVRPLVQDAFVRSLKLGLLAFVIVVPLSIFGGVVAALKRGRPADRAITIFGQSATAMPEFVSGIFLIVIFGLGLGWFPALANWPPGTGFFGQLKYLFLPAMSLVLVLFGYIARMARAGTITSLESDYARTAYLKGLSRRTVIWRHVLRNSLLPTITVIATQTGYLIGGLVIVETLFNYSGIGRLIYDAARTRDYPLLESGVLSVGLIYMVATIVADALYSVLNPRIRYGGTE
jgi:peptide/nickel transport system permease protein